MKFFLIVILSIYLFGKKEERIVTLSPSINEIVFALGMGKQIVANTQYCNYPKESLVVKKVGGYSSISVEKILKVKPSIVLAQNYDKKLLKNLNKLAIKNMSFSTNSLSEIKSTILKLGLYFKKEIRAKEIIENIDEELKTLNNILVDKKILIVISPRFSLHNQIYITGNNIYFEDIIKESGNKNAFFSTNKAQPVVNIEKIIAMNPDIIILLTPYLENKKEDREKLKNLWLSIPVNASKAKNIYTVHKEYAGIPSDRIVYFIKDFKEILENVRNKKL